MKVGKGPGGASSSGLNPTRQPNARPQVESGGRTARSQAAAGTQYTQARSASAPSSATGSPSSVFRQENSTASTRTGRVDARALELSDRLSNAPPEIKGAELARLHLPETLARVQRTLLPMADALKGPASIQSASTSRLSPVSLPAASQKALHSAATLAAEALRLEDCGSGRLTSQAVSRTLFRLDLAILGRNVEGDRGLDEIRSASQQAMAGLSLH